MSTEQRQSMIFSKKLGKFFLMTDFKGVFWNPRNTPWVPASSPLLFTYDFTSFTHPNFTIDYSFLHVRLLPPSPTLTSQYITPSFTHPKDYSFLHSPSLHVRLLFLSPTSTLHKIIPFFTSLHTIFHINLSLGKLNIYPRHIAHVEIYCHLFFIIVISSFW